MKAIYFCIVVFSSLFQLKAQQDTIVAIDYTKVLVGVDQHKEFSSITSLEEVTIAGFFIDKHTIGQIKICHPNQLFIWVNGKLFDEISKCKLFSPNQLFSLAESDTIFISLSSPYNLSKLQCELIIYETLYQAKKEPFEILQISDFDSFEEFTIIAILLLAFFLGFLNSSYPSRITHIKKRTLTFQTSAYGFINTNFFSPASINLLLFYAFSLGFISLYFNQLLNLNFFETSNNFLEFIWNWIKLSFFVFVIFIVKWLSLSLISQLFKLHKLKKFQMFDFLNFNTIVLFVLFLFLLIDFIFNPSYQSWLSTTLLYIFPISLIVFVIWLIIKFIINLPRKKLAIISYLCVTEIIPIIILFKYLYK